MSYLNKSNNIPNYIQKEIIKLICEQSNRINKRLCEFDLQENENQIYKGINYTILSFSLVCWFWFKTCSNNINVINYNKISNLVTINPTNSIIATPLYSNLYSIINIKNISTIILESSLIKNSIDKINKLIKQQHSLKKILIQINYSNNNNQNIQIMSIIGKIEFSNIRISNFEFDASITSFMLPINIKKIKSVGVLNNYSTSMILSNLRNLSKFKELYICNYNNRFPFKELSNLGRLSSIQYYDTHKTSIKIEDLYHMLKSSPNLKLLAIHICIDDLIYQLSCPKLNKPCVCSNNGSINNNVDSIFGNYNISNNTDQLPFSYYWKYVSRLIKNHKNLKSLFIYSLCKNNETSGLNYLKKSTISNHFISQFGGMLSKNKSIKKLHFSGFHTPQLLESIINNNNTTLNSIQFKFQNSNLSNQKKTEFINTFDQILNNNYSHRIKSFKFIEVVNKDVDSLLFSFEK